MMSCEIQVDLYEQYLYRCSVKVTYDYHKDIQIRDTQNTKTPKTVDYI